MNDTCQTISIHKIDLTYDLKQYTNITFIGGMWNKEKIH